jgi:hypothetical protein
MLYVIALNKNAKGEIVKLKTMHSPEVPDYTGIVSYNNLINFMKEGTIRYSTAIQINGEWKKGAQLELVDGHLRTKGNNTTLDNLDNLPLFE